MIPGREAGRKRPDRCRLMRHNQLPVDYLLFADEGHGFAQPDNRLKFYAAAEDFLSRYLGGRREPPTEKENWESLKSKDGL